ncbi:2-oxoglutarate ferredoxin oxidoreductase subunit alpha [Caldanaerobius fijiensis DSM 17918]|uniref:2-oxoglutarate ferredoxin oxidoreductase subunit alpha n=1 Tax=Caldanaerobius fijiensis DSM 17918 TaxID=1121256 RepID=A0A1M4VQ32_9THEO|nr:2-oxoglutarate ferredoxin oxidoreductase subunit alpha [Caldanaerobius fijiensis DSM 17918]
MKILMKGNEAMAEAAVMSGCRYYFGYPITPQNEVTAYMAKRLPEVGGVFLQAESEVSAINMVYGAGGAGGRVMISSSSPGISLMQEGISYIAGAEIPCVIVNVMRGGPGLGNITAAQSDYLQATKGGGHGDYHLIVLAPASVQEIADMMDKAFDLADKYRNPVMVLMDGILGQMMEPVEFKEKLSEELPVKQKDWATTGMRDREKPNLITSLYIEPEALEQHNYRLKEKYDRIKQNEVMYEEFNIEGAEIVIVAYGITSRIAKTAISMASKEGLRVGLIRPITLWPFPYKAFDNLDVKALLTVEMSLEQMYEDVLLASNGRIPVHFLGRPGGVVIEPAEIVNKVKSILGRY